MKLLRAATLTVADIKRSTSLYAEFFDYSIVEEGLVDSNLAASWSAPNSAGQPYAIMQPSSGAEIYIRFIEQPAVDSFKALRTYGWNAIEICVTDVLAANERMENSPFEIIGPPREIDGLPAIYPMQVRGPDEEIVYLTQIRSDLPAFDLPRASTLIDKLFILVMGCSDMDEGNAWLAKHAGVEMGRDMEIVYTMLAGAYGTDMDELHRISTMIHGRDVFLEIDQYPEAATQRENHEGMLPPGVAIGSMWHPEFDSLPGPWITEPVVRDGPIYKGKRAGTMIGPDGTLVEMIEG
ncbi:glyoxalase/bleomycin resistance/dioxygenase family protein [Hirschia maritima]|uniref:glyoxalase/bleomycin resistance/dioxygenase family protein n=1 Tax=Hirschia maritima TaxID=1121961 RepID=UPI00037A3488|nr:glyoxalase/bleomycin resistance/dioxygenase family protein [Hirschia maritima]